MAPIFRSLMKPQQIILLRLFTVNTILNSFSTLSEPQPQPPCSSSSEETELMGICRKVPGRSFEVVSVFKNYGLSSAQILDIFSRIPHLMRIDPEKNLQPKLAFLSESGISGQNLVRLICANPSILRKGLSGDIGPCIMMLKTFFPCPDGDDTVSHLSVKQVKRALNKFSKLKPQNIGKPENIHKLLRMGLGRDLLSDADKKREAMEMGFNTLILKFIISVMKAVDK